MTEVEKLLVMLRRVARATANAVNEAEFVRDEVMGDGFKVVGRDAVEVYEALNALDDLCPDDDEPGYTLDEGGKASWLLEKYGLLKRDVGR